MNITQHVLFKSQVFNTTQPKDYFINDCCFGDDLCQWLIRELNNLGFKTEGDPGQEDFGWYFDFQVGKTVYTFLVGYRPGENESDGDWIGTLERNSGVNVVSFFFGAASRGIQLDAAKAIHAVLSSSRDIRDIRWYTVQDFKTESNPQSAPSE